MAYRAKIFASYHLKNINTISIDILIIQSVISCWQLITTDENKHQLLYQANFVVAKPSKNTWPIWIELSITRSDYRWRWGSNPNNNRPARINWHKYRPTSKKIIDTKSSSDETLFMKLHNETVWSKPLSSTYNIGWQNTLSLSISVIWSTTQNYRIRSFELYQAQKSSRKNKLTSYRLLTTVTLSQ